MTLSRWALAFALAAALCGCASNAVEVDSAMKTEPVIEGSVDTVTADAAVVIVSDKLDQLATGVLVAPTLVLTSRHLPFLPASAQDQPFFLHCSEDPDGKLTGEPITEALNPADYGVAIINKQRKNVVKGVRFFAGAALDLCENDMVLLQLDNAVTDVAPFPLRLDGPPVARERGWLVGWGMTEQSDDVLPDQGLVTADAPMRVAIDVRAVGKTDFVLPNGSSLLVPDGMFLAPPSGCYGDNGGPFIAQSGAVIGILSNIVPSEPTGHSADEESQRDCRLSPSVFRSLATQSAWIRDAFVQAGEVPWLENLARPAALAEPCQDNRECLSGSCVSTSGHAFCSRSCEVDACPAGLQCLGEAGTRSCLPARLKVSAETSSSCAVQRAPAAASKWLLGMGVALTVFSRRRRRKSKFVNKVRRIS